MINMLDNGGEGETESWMKFCICRASDDFLNNIIGPSSSPSQYLKLG